MTLYWRILQFGRRKKDHGSPTRCMLKDLSFSYGNLDLAASNSRNTRKFFLILLRQFCLFQTFCIISSVLFPFKLLLVSLLNLPPNIQQLNIKIQCLPSKSQTTKSLWLLFLYPHPLYFNTIFVKAGAYVVLHLSTTFTMTYKLLKYLILSAKYRGH